MLMKSESAAAQAALLSPRIGMADKSVHPPHRRPTQGIRQFPLRQQLRETLDNSGLPHARLAHQNQIILPALQQDWLATFLMRVLQ